MVFNITEHVQGVQYMLRFWRSDGVLNLNTHFYSVVFDLFCIFRENTHEQQLIQAKILYQCPSRNILDFVYGGSHFSTGGHFSTCQTRKKSTPVTFFLHMRHVFLRPGVISLRRKMTPRSIFDGGRYSSLHRHKLYHFTVANTRFTAPLTRRGKTKFATVKWYNLCRQIIQSQTCYPLNLSHDIQPICCK